MTLIVLFPADAALGPLAAAGVLAVAWFAVIAAEVAAAVWARAAGFGWLAAGQVALSVGPDLVRLVPNATQRGGAAHDAMFFLQAGVAALAYVAMVVGVVLLARRIRDLSALVELMAAEPVAKPDRLPPGSSRG